jgi:predicted nucleotidyltransferase
LGLSAALRITGDRGYTAAVGILERYQLVLDRLLVELQRLYGKRLVACAVFGSVGRGTPRDGSDIDLLIVADDLPSGRMSRSREFDPVEERLAADLRACVVEGPPSSISPVFKTRAEIEHGSPLLIDMTEDARILFDREGFLARALDRLRGRLRELGARRVFQGNAWYWVLKRDFTPGEVFEL